MSVAATAPRLLVIPVEVMGESELPNTAIGALVDSGATNSFIGVDLVEKASLVCREAPEMVVTLADGSTVTSRHVCDLPLALAGGLRQQVTCRLV